VVLVGLTIVECCEVELLMQLLRHRLLHAVIADPHGRDRMPVLVGCILLSDRWHHLWWYHAAQGVKCHHLLLLIGVVVLDNAPESSRLQLHFHQERPIEVTGLGEGRVASPTTYLTNYPLYHDSIFGGVIDLLPRHLHNKD
jgi:hypothetical protein